MVNFKNLFSGVGVLLLVGGIIIPYQVNATLNPTCITEEEITNCVQGGECISAYDLNRDGSVDVRDASVALKNCYVLNPVKVNDICITVDDIIDCMAGQKQCGSEYDLNGDGVIDGSDKGTVDSANKKHMCYVVGPTMVDDVCIRSDDIIDCMAGQKQCGSEHDLNGDGVIDGSDKGTVDSANKERMCYVLTSSVASLITLKPGLNTFSTPTITKSIYFSNGGNNISFATMEKEKWVPINFTDSNAKSVIYPLKGYIVRNDNSSDVTMTIMYDTNSSSPSTFSKNLDVGWNFLGITRINNPFDHIKNTQATMKYDLTNGSDTNLIQIGVNYTAATRYMLTKSYAVFVNSNGVYEGENSYVGGDKEGPDLYFSPNGGINVTGVTVSIYDTNNLRSGSIIKYKWQKDSICSTERSGYTELSIIMGEFSTEGYASVSTNGLSGEYYLCILDNTVFDILGNGNRAMKSLKFIFNENNEGGDATDSVCRIEQNPTEPTIGGVTLTIHAGGLLAAHKWFDEDEFSNESSPKVVTGNGTYTADVQLLNGTTGSCSITVSNIYNCDVNGDGYFNLDSISADNAAFSDCELSTIKVNESNYRCDVNGDGRVGSADAAAYETCISLA